MHTRTTLTILLLASLTLAAANAAGPGIAITQARATPATAAVGETLTLSARVKNTGATTIAAGKLRADFTLTSPAGAQIPAGSASTTVSLAPGSECSLQVRWSSAGAAAGTYNLKVHACCLDGGAAETTNILQGTPRLSAGSLPPPPPAPKPTGSLTVRVEDWDGSRGDGAVELTRGGVKIGEQRTSAGRAEWLGLELGDYVVTVRRSRDGVEENWGSSGVKVAGPTEHTFRRSSLAAAQITVNGKQSGWPITSLPGTPIKITVTVHNPGAAAKSGRIRFSLDRDAAGTLDYDYLSQAESVPAGGERIFEWTASPTEPGTYSLRVSVQGEASTVTSYSGWTPAVTRVEQTTTLSVAFTDASGAPTECVGELFSAAGAPLGERRGAGVEWSAVPLGTHRLRFWRTSTEGLGLRELWGTMDIKVTGPASVTARRQTPLLAALEVNGQPARSLPVPASTATLQVTVKNPGALSRETKVRVILDRDGQQPYDFDSTSPPKTVSAGGQAAYEFTYTPREGTYRLAAAALVDEGEWQPTSQLGWIDAVETAERKLRVLVRDEAGAAAADARVIRYDSAGKRLDEAKARQGAAEWLNVPDGSYRIEVYAGGEYWGSAAVTVQGSTQAEFTRRAELLTRLETPAKAYAGDPVKLRLHVACLEAGKATRVQLRGYAAGSEAPVWESSAERKLAPGADSVFEFTFTPQAAAAYSFRAAALGDYGGLRTTDTAEWRDILKAEAAELAVAPVEPAAVVDPPVTFRVKVTRLGQPAQGAEVTVWVSGEKAGTARTDASGVASVAGWIPVEPGEATVTWWAEALLGASTGKSPERELRVRALESGYAATPQRFTVTYRGSAYTATRVIAQRAQAGSTALDACLHRSWQVTDAHGKLAADPETYSAVARIAEAAATLPTAAAIREEVGRLRALTKLKTYPSALLEAALKLTGKAAGVSPDPATGDRVTWLTGILRSYQTGATEALQRMLLDASKELEEAAAAAERGSQGAEEASEKLARGVSLARAALRGLAVSRTDAGLRSLEAVIGKAANPAQAKALEADAGFKAWAAECGGAAERWEQQWEAVGRAARMVQSLLGRGTLASVSAEPAPAAGFLMVEAEASAQASVIEISVSTRDALGAPAAASIKVTLLGAAGEPKAVTISSDFTGKAHVSLPHAGSCVILVEAAAPTGAGYTALSVEASKSAQAKPPTLEPAAQPTGEGAVSVTLSPGSSPPKQGGAFTVSLQVKAARGVQCGEFTVEYDPGTLQLLGVEAGDLFGGKAIRVTEHRDEENGVLTLVLARGDSAPAQSSGAAARLSFKARGADAGISLASAKLSDATYRELTGVTLSGYRAAAGGGVDATGDGAVDYRDAAAVTSAYGSSRGQQAYAAAADLNGDGRVGLLELALVASVGRSVEAAAGTVAVSVKAPSAIKEGEEFTATIEARWSATAPAGFEAAVRVDPRGFKILGVEKGDAFGSSPLVGALKYSASEGTAFAALAGAPTEVGGALLKLRLLPLSRPGSFTVSVEKASFCDASGNPIEATLGTPGLITLQSVSLPAVRAAKGFQPPEEGPLALVGGVGAVGVLGAATLLVKRASVPAPVLEPALELEAPMRPVPRRRRVKPKVGVEGAPLPVPRIED